MPTLRTALIPLMAACALTAADPFFFYAENAGQEEAAVKYRLNGVSQRTYLGSNTIHLRDNFGEMALRFAAGEPASYQSLERWPGILNRFEGASRNWRRAIPAHRRVQYTSIAPNLDALFGSADGVPTLTFVVRPGGDADSLFLETDLARTAFDAATGTWTIGSIPQWAVKKPRAWQEIRGATATVDSRFRTVSSARVGITVGAFDRTQPLYLEVGFPIAPLTGTAANGVPDKAGNTYAPIRALSDRVCSVNPAGGRNFCPDAGATGSRANGEPVFLTILAGDYDDISNSPLFLDRDGNVVIVGRTGSAGFPVTSDAQQPVNAGPIGAFPRLFQFGGDLFVSILDPKTGDLNYSTFFGGAEAESGVRFASGPDSSIAIQISTGKSFPVTSGAWLTEGGDAVAVFEPSRRRFRFATFVPAGVNVVSVRIGPDLSVYLSGNGRDGSPTTKDALQPGYGGGERDGYLVRLSPDGTRALFATYFGGPAEEQLGLLDVSAAGDLWIYGNRQSIGFENSEHFLVHLSGDGSRLASPTVAIPVQTVFDLRVVPGGDIAVLARTTTMAEFTTADAFLRGGCDEFRLPGYFQVFHPDGTIRLATYLVPGEVRGIDELYEDYRRRAGQPVIPGTPNLICVTGAADRRNSSSVSPGQIVTLLGSALGPKAAVVTAPGQDGKYPAAVAGLRVFADGIPLPLLYAEAGQINAIMPYSVQPGTRLMVTVEYEGRRSPPLAMDVVSSAFQLFSLNGTGAGQAVAFNEDGRLNSPSNRAQPGSIVVVYGTGAGLTTPAAADGVLAPLGPLEVLPRPRGKVVAQLSGYSVVAFGEVLYAGAAPGLVNGLTQINFRLPDTPFPSNFSGMYPAFSIDGGTLGSGQVSIWVRGTEP